MIEYKRNAEPPFVRVTADDGTIRDWPLNQFEADPAFYVGQTGNGIAPPFIEQTTEQKLAATQAELDELRQKHADLEAVVIGNNEGKPDARTDLSALIAALKADGVIDDEKLDAQRKSSYRDNGDGTVSLLDRYGKPVKTFDPNEIGPDQNLYRTWLSLGGKPLPPDLSAQVMAA